VFLVVGWFGFPFLFSSDINRLARYLRFYPVFLVCACFLEKSYIVVLWLYPVVVRMPKIRLFVKSRTQGSRIESIPLKRLAELSGYRKKHWSFEDGWLILEAC
jgi:hypothetical protein